MAHAADFLSFIEFWGRIIRFCPIFFVFSENISIFALHLCMPRDEKIIHYKETILFN